MRHLAPALKAGAFFFVHARVGLDDAEPPGFASNTPGGRAKQFLGARRTPRNQPAFLEAPSTPGKQQHKPCIERESSRERFRALICFEHPRST